MVCSLRICFLQKSFYQFPEEGIQCRMRGSPQGGGAVRGVKQAKEDEPKQHIIGNTVRELEIHAALEEEIFYPCRRRAIDEKESSDEAREEHHVAKLLIGELKKMGADDERYDAKYTVLTESVRHHIEEKESELFPKLQGKLDTKKIGKRMEVRKLELQQQPQKRSRRRGAKAKPRTRARKGRQTARRKTRKKAVGPALVF